MRRGDRAYHERGETCGSRGTTELPDSGHVRPQKVTPAKRNSPMRQYCGAWDRQAAAPLNSV